MSMTTLLGLLLASRGTTEAETAGKGSNYLIYGNPILIIVIRLVGQNYRSTFHCACRPSLMHAATAAPK